MSCFPTSWFVTAVLGMAYVIPGPVGSEVAWPGSVAAIGLLLRFLSSSQVDHRTQAVIDQYGLGFRRHPVHASGPQERFPARLATIWRWVSTKVAQVIHAFKIQMAIRFQIVSH